MGVSAIGSDHMVPADHDYSMLLVFSGIWTFLVDAYPLYAASALAANVFARCMFAGAFPLFGEQSAWFQIFLRMHAVLDDTNCI